MKDSKEKCYQFTMNSFNHARNWTTLSFSLSFLPNLTRINLKYIICGYALVFGSGLWRNDRNFYATMILITVHTFKKGKNSQKLSVILKKLLIQSPFKFQPNICQSFYLIENLLISLIINFIVCLCHTCGSAYKLLPPYLFTWTKISFDVNMTILSK